jgi:GT2 family glycosyltransferase
MTDLRLSVIICAYTLDRWDQLVEAVGSVHTQSTPAAEVIVVVDHNDELLERATRTFAGGVTTVLPNIQRRGLAGARNTGVEASGGDVVVFLDDDARATPGWLEEMCRHYADPAVIGVGGLVVPLWADGVPAWFPPEFGWVVGCSYTGQPERTAQVRNPIGANMSFRRDPVLAVGGFRVEVGRVGADALGGEETELSIRLGQHYPGTRILHEPAAVVHHHVPADRGRWAYYRRRCWAEGVSKAQVRRLSSADQALGSERAYVRRALPLGVARDVNASVAAGNTAGIVRAGAIVSGLALTVGGYATATARTRLVSTATEPENTMQGTQMPASGWLNFDVHGKVGIRVAARAPGAPQLQAMLACFATDRDVPADIEISEKPEPMPDSALLEHELAYTEAAVRFVRERVQVILEEEQYRVHGAGELLTSLVPVLDRAMVTRGAAMIHAATVAYNGQAIALPAAGGTGKTSTVAKLMRREGWTFMGDDWAFLSDDAQLLGYEKPMFIKPHHKAIYPHLFEGARKPLVPVRLSRGVGRVTTVVHPYVIRYPRVADFSRRWSPEHMMVTAEQAFPGRKPTTAAPLAASVYIERFEGARSRLVEKDPEWMVDRMLGNFHIEMAEFSQQIVTGLAASSVLPWSRWVEDKATVLLKALDGRPCHLLQVPSVYTPDEASDDIVEFLEELLPSFVGDQAP